MHSFDAVLFAGRSHHEFERDASLGILHVGSVWKRREQQFMFRALGRPRRPTWRALCRDRPWTKVKLPTHPRRRYRLFSPGYLHDGEEGELPLESFC